MMLNVTFAVFDLPVTAEVAVTNSVCGPGDRSIGFIEIAQPLKSNWLPKLRETIEPVGFPDTFSEPLLLTRMLTPCAQLVQGVPKLPKTELSLRAGGESIYAVMVLMPAPRS